MGQTGGKMGALERRARIAAQSSLRAKEACDFYLTTHRHRRPAHPAHALHPLLA